MLCYSESGEKENQSDLPLTDGGGNQSRCVFFFNTSCPLKFRVHVDDNNFATFQYYTVEQHTKHVLH